ncbi:MAG: hypothetical protein U9Q70_12755 [Chloroflexota bacterium]|nr:hypothetical protein [Chloroflexota bacterium]
MAWGTEESKDFAAFENYFLTDIVGWLTNSLGRSLAASKTKKISIYLR